MNEEKIKGLESIVGRAKTANMLQKGPYIEQAVDWMIDIIKSQQMQIDQLHGEVNDAATKK